MQRYVERLGPAALIALGLMVGGFLLGGRYQAVPARGDSVWVIDRITGTPRYCSTFSNGWSCAIFDYAERQGPPGPAPAPYDAEAPAADAMAPAADAAAH